MSGMSGAPRALFDAAGLQVAGEARVARLAAAVEGIDAPAAADELEDDGVELLKRLAGGVFEMLRHQWPSPRRPSPFQDPSVRRSLHPLGIGTTNRSQGRFCTWWPPARSTAIPGPHRGTPKTAHALDNEHLRMISA